MRLLYNTMENAAPRIIDSNSAMDAIVARLREESRKPKAQEIARTEDESGFTEGLVFAPLDPDAPSAAEGEEGTEAPAPKVPGVDYEAIAKEQAERIVEGAKAKAADILVEAREAAMKECDSIKAAAHDEGFNKGVSDGRAQMDAMAAENEERFNARVAELEAEYRSKAELLEADIVGATVSIFEKVFGQELSASEEVLLHLVRSTIVESDNSKEFHIRVSKDDVQDMREHLDELKSCVGSDCMLEVLSDHSLEKGQCLIETEAGIFDCGAQLQMQNIFRNLKALSGA